MRLMALRMNPPQAALVAGISSLLIGLLYWPKSPWYILGDLKEAEIGAWGQWAAIGGISAVIGAGLLAPARGFVRKMLLLACMYGMAAMVLAQVPAIFFWVMYGMMGAEFTKLYMLPSWAGMALGAVMHLWVAAAAALSAASAGIAWGSPVSKSKLSQKDRLILGTSLLFCALLGFAWNEYQDRSWMARTYPADGAVNVPSDITVTANWHGQRSNNLGLRVRYAEDPDLAVPGMTGAGPSGMTFRPDPPFQPGKTVIVTVEAGRRTHTFRFTTAER